jgi:hypothetical protein
MKKVVVGETLPAQKLAQKKSIALLIKETNILVLISICSLFLVFIILVVTLITLVVLNKSALVVTQTDSNEIQINGGTQTINKLTVPTPRPLPAGPQVYSVSSRSSIAIKQFYISALNTKIGDLQTMKLTIEDPKAAVNNVSIKLITDKKSENHVLSLKSGNGNNGTWEGTWKTNDTHDYTYQAQVTIKDAGGNTFISEPSFR